MVLGGIYIGLRFRTELNMVVIPARWKAVRQFVGREQHQTSQDGDEVEQISSRRRHEVHACHFR